MKVNHLFKKMKVLQGKKGKKEEIVKSDKTMTGKKPTKVEIEPQVK